MSAATKSPFSKEELRSERRNNAFLFLLFFVTTIAAVSIAQAALDHFVILIRAILGLAVLYLLYTEYIGPQHEPDISGIHARFPRDFKYIPWCFSAALLFYWSFSQVVTLFQCYLIPQVFSLFSR